MHRPQSQYNFQTEKSLPEYRHYSPSKLYPIKVTSQQIYSPQKPHSSQRENNNKANNVYSFLNNTSLPKQSSKYAQPNQSNDNNTSMRDLLSAPHHRNQDTRGSLQSQDVQPEQPQNNYHSRETFQPTQQYRPTPYQQTNYQDMKKIFQPNQQLQYQPHQQPHFFQSNQQPLHQQPQQQPYQHPQWQPHNLQTHLQSHQQPHQQTDIDQPTKISLLPPDIVSSCLKRFSELELQQALDTIDYKGPEDSLVKDKIDRVQDLLNHLRSKLCVEDKEASNKFQIKIFYPYRDDFDETQKSLNEIQEEDLPDDQFI